MKALFLSLFLFIVSSMSIFAQGNERAPLPCHALFNYQVLQTADSGIVVQFTNRSSAYNFSLWRFSANDSSTAQNPLFEYASNLDSAIVCLTVTDSLGTCRETVCDTISLLASGIAGVDNDESIVLVYPNPIYAKAEIVYNIQEPALVTIDVINMLGQRVMQLFNGAQTTGRQQITWATNNVPDGIYLVRITLNDQNFTRRVSVMH